MNSANKSKGKPADSSPKSASAKKSFVLRVDEATYKALERWAADDFRSVNGQIEWLLAQSLKKAGRQRERKGTGEDGPSSE